MSPSGYEQWEQSVSGHLGESPSGGSSTNDDSEYEAILLADEQVQEQLCRDYLRRHEKDTTDAKHKIENLLQTVISQKLANQAPVPVTNNNNLNQNIANNNNANNNNANRPPNVQAAVINVQRIANSPRLNPKPPQPPAKTWNSAESPEARGKDGPRRFEAVPENLSPAEQFALIKKEKNEKNKHYLIRQFIQKHSKSHDPEVWEMFRQLSRDEVGTAYVNQALGKEHPIYNPQGAYNFKHIDGKGKKAVENNTNDPSKAAIGIYTGEAYKHINPSVANDPDWLDENQAPNPPPKPKEPDSDDPAAVAKYRKDHQLYLERLERYGKNMKEYLERGKQERIDEGVVHGAFAMEGLKNLPSQQGILYRGERWTPAEFNQKYRKGAMLDKVNPTSMSTDKEVATNFALYGNAKVPKEKNTGVLVVAETFGGKDISGISVNPDEQERLFSAGVLFLVSEIKPCEQQTDNGPIPYFEVHLKQVDPKNRK